MVMFQCRTSFQFGIVSVLCVTLSVLILAQELNALRLPSHRQRITKRQARFDQGRTELIDCYSTASLCNGVRRVTTVSECCLGEGLAYQREGNEGCLICVVFGWHEREFTAPESSRMYTLTVGYMKGALELQENIDFDIVPQLYMDPTNSTTDEDITVITKSITIGWRDTAPVQVMFKLNRDRYGDEGNEMIPLRLVNTAVPSSERYFFKQDVPIIIEDRPAHCPSNGINCNDNGCDSCLPRYTGQGCCDCQDGFFLDPDNFQCEVPCSNTIRSCQGGVCTCVTGFGQPDCCQCDNFYYDPLPDAGGVNCQRACDIGVEICVRGVCTCKDGYTGIECCSCSPDHYKEGEQCKPACVDNVVRCTKGRCTCQEGYSGPGCCDCANRYIRDVTTNRCIAPCFEGVLSCTEQDCECREGYKGIDCCECSVTYYRDNCLDICTLIEMEEGRTDLVDCYTTTQCSGTRRQMSRELCCIHSNGVSYNLEGEENCRPCVVYGWKYQCAPFIEPEREQQYEFELGYLKGSLELQEDLTFQVVPLLLTASNDDFIIHNETVQVSYRDTELKLMGVTLVLDGVAQEENEMFTMELRVVGTEPTGDNFYFLRNQTITIRDTDVKCATGTMRCGRDPMFCACRNEYKEPDCCDCVDGYFKDPENNQCFLPCPKSTITCTNGECECHGNYTGVDCCECANGYYMEETSGLCQEFCDPGIESCDTGTCVCATGYTGPGCCQCDVDYERKGDVCVEKRCVIGVESCSSTTCICNRGYTGPNCCDCATGYFRDPTNSSICLAPCFEGTSICTEADGCTCNPGYIGPDCCECDSTYYRSRCSNICSVINVQDIDNSEHVNCYTDGACGTTRRLMTRDLCCVESNGLSYNIEGSETCSVCVVYGWKDTCSPFRAPEREQSYSFELGYIKGNSEHQQDFTWRLRPQPMSASNSDFTLNTQQVRVLFRSTESEEAEVTFVVDGIAQEGDETFEVDLEFADVPEPSEANIFFMRTKMFVIVDNDTTCDIGTLSCPTSDGCICKPEYLPPSCCDCVDGYYKDKNGVCQLPCSNNIIRCTNNECVCRPTFAGPGCCYCEIGANCTDSMCACKVGYAGDDCCDCAQDYEKEGDECRELLCENGVESCTANGRCNCKTGYTGPKCCMCATGYYKDPVTQNCVAPCFIGTEQCTEGGSCTCKPGYVGGDCCECDTNYYRHECFNTCTLIEDDSDDFVDCYTDGSCQGPRRRMSRETCCRLSVGVSYKTEGSESCQICVVYGWKDHCRPFRAPEREESYSCELGYIKGNNEYQEDFTWRLQPRLINASYSDFTIDTSTVRVLFRSTSLEEARFTFVKDGIAQEPDETFEIDLVFADVPEPIRDGFFFLKTKTLTIIDVDKTCTNGTETCTDDGVCMCKAGYLEPYCCECVDGYYYENGECKLPCQNGLIECSNGECTCKKGFAKPDCCKCAEGYYRDEDECKLPKTECLPGIVKCVEGVCTCNTGHVGIDCCNCTTDYIKNEESLRCISCSAIQDIYFVIDATLSFDPFSFCETVAALQLIAEAIQPQKTLEASRVGAYLYPVSSTSQSNDMRFFPVGKYQCADVLLRFHRLAMQFSFSKNWGYGSKILGSITLPVRVIDLIRNDILQELMMSPELASRRRVILIVTDGESDNEESDLRRSMNNLVGSVANGSLTIISAGLSSGLAVTNRESFRRDLTILANEIEANAVSADSDIELSRQIVQRMAKNGAICESQEREILASLEEGTNVKYCRCYSPVQQDECPCNPSNSCRKDFRPFCD